MSCGAADQIVLVSGSLTDIVYNGIVLVAQSRLPRNDKRCFRRDKLVRTREKQTMIQLQRSLNSLLHRILCSCVYVTQRSDEIETRSFKIAA